MELHLPGPFYNGTFSHWSFAANESAFYVAAMLNRNNNTGTGIGDTASVWVWTIPVAEFEAGSIPNGPSTYWFGTVSAFVPIPTITPASLEGVQAAAGDLLVNMYHSLVLYSMPPATCSSFQSCTGNYTVIPGYMNDASLVYAPMMPNAATSTTGAPITQTTRSGSTSETTPATTSTSKPIATSATTPAPTTSTKPTTTSSSATSATTASTESTSTTSAKSTAKPVPQLPNEAIVMIVVGIILIAIVVVGALVVTRRKGAPSRPPQPPSNPG